MSLPQSLARAVVVAFSACLVATGASGAQSSSAVAFTNATVVDVRDGRRLADHTVVVEGTRIASVGPSATARPPAGATVVDARGKFLIPGMWDMHVHFDEDALTRSLVLPLLVANGVTGVREMWADCIGCEPDSALGPIDRQVLRLRDDVRAGRLLGPRLVYASAPLDGPYGPDPWLNVVRTGDDARRVVASAAAKGYDVVGTYAGLGMTGYVAAAEEARARELMLAGPAPFVATFDEMRAAGQRTRDNVFEWFIACSTAGDSLRTELRAAAEADAADTVAKRESRFWKVYDDTRALRFDTFDAGRCDREARRVAGFGAWQVPRLVYTRPEAAFRDSLADPERTFLPPAMDSSWARRLARVRRDSAGSVSRLAARESEIVGILHRAGVPLLVGTETHGGSNVWGFSVHEEMAALVKAGLSPLSALRAATLEPARSLAAEDSLGTVERGKLADLVLLDADPLANIANTRRIAGVVANGRWYDRRALDAILAGARERVRARR